MTVEAEHFQDHSLEDHYKASTLLSGMPDFTYGMAEDYFRRLNDEDREIVSWYLQQGIGPYQIEYYVSSLVKGYALVDPDRKAREAMDSAHTELRRINRLLEIFLTQGNFFPNLEVCNISVRDEDGNYEGSIEVQGWTSFAEPGEGAFSLQSYKRSIKNSHINEYIELAHSFIDDPTCAPHVFNQDEMIRQVKESMTDSIDW